MKKVFWRLSLLACITMSFVLVWCGSSVKTWPIETWDVVYVDFTASYEMFGDLVYDTTDADVWETNNVTLDKPSFAPVSIKIGDTNSKVPQKVHTELLGKVVWDSIKVKVTPDEWFWSLYDTSNISEQSSAVFQKAGIPLRVGSLQYVWKSPSVIKEIRWNGDDQVVVFDTNPLETFNTLIYKVEILQVGWKKLLTPEEQAEATK